MTRSSGKYLLDLSQMSESRLFGNSREFRGSAGLLWTDSRVDSAMPQSPLHCSAGLRDAPRTPRR